MASSNESIEPVRLMSPSKSPQSVSPLDAKWWPEQKCLVTAVVGRLLLSLLRVVRGSVRVSLLLLPSCFPVRQFRWSASTPSGEVSGSFGLTLLGRGAIWGRSWGTVAAAVGLAIPLLGDAVGLLGCATITHLLLAAITAAAVATASTAAAAAAWTGVRGLVDADGPSVEPERYFVRAAS